MRYQARPEHDFERKLGWNAHYLHSTDQLDLEQQVTGQRDWTH